MAETSIQWTDKTWNPVRGCALVSEGCRSCYAMKQAHRFSGPGKPYDGLTRLGNHGPLWTGHARPVPEMLAQPLKWRKPSRIFVNSMSDLFHKDVPDDYIAAVFGVMAACPQHTFQILTKRAERMVRWFDSAAHRSLDWCACMADDALESHAPRSTRALAFAPGRGAKLWPLPGVWLGVSVENQAAADERIPHLLRTPAAVRFLSVEPMLGPVTLRPWLTSAILSADDAPIDWVIVGSESGPGARPMDVDWARSIVEQCRAAGVNCFVKQIATPAALAAGDRKGGDPAHWPAGDWPREFPVTP